MTKIYNITARHFRSNRLLGYNIPQLPFRESEMKRDLWGKMLQIKLYKYKIST